MTDSDTRTGPVVTIMTQILRCARPRVAQDAAVPMRCLSCHRGGHRWLNVLTGRVSGGQRRFRPLRVREPDPRSGGADGQGYRRQLLTCSLFIVADWENAIQYIRQYGWRDRDLMVRAITAHLR